MFGRTASLASLVALAAAAASPALAACDVTDRPPVPLNMKAQPKTGATSSAIFFSWQWAFTRRVERVCWDIEITDSTGKITRSGAGVGPCVSAHNRFTVPYTLDHLEPKTTRCMRVRARTEPGTQGCVSDYWTAKACATTTEDAKARGCTVYANRAVAVVKLARDTYKCDPATISGPRWTASFEEHRRWCMGAAPSAANSEDRERQRIAQECRIATGKPKGNAKLQVTQKGDSFTLTGGGYAPNSRVIIRVTGPGGTKKNFTNQFANAKGVFTATLTGLQICDKPVGTVTFTAEDQDNKPSAPVTALCR